MTDFIAINTPTGEIRYVRIDQLAICYQQAFIYDQIVFVPVVYKRQDGKYEIISNITESELDRIISQLKGMGCSFDFTEMYLQMLNGCSASNNEATSESLQA